MNEPLNFSPAKILAGMRPLSIIAVGHGVAALLFALTPAAGAEEYQSETERRLGIIKKKCETGELTHCPHLEKKRPQNGADTPKQVSRSCISDGFRGIRPPIRVERAVKEVLADPGSYEFVSASQIGRDIIIVFRGSNAYGAKVVDRAVVTTDGNCNPVSVK